MGLKLRHTEVVDIVDISPHMRRIILGGQGLVDFPANQESAHVKVSLAEIDGQLPALSSLKRGKRVMRSYTIRHFDKAKNHLSIDFAINDHQGPITNWANKANIGDKLDIAGPGSKKHTSLNAPWHLLIGDLTALPALAATIEMLPKDASGYAIIQVPDERDIQNFSCPKDLQIRWLIAPYQAGDQLLQIVQEIEWPGSQPAIFLAAEASQVKKIKAYLLTKPGFNSENLYASAYWKAKESR